MTGHPVKVEDDSNETKQTERDRYNADPNQSVLFLTHREISQAHTSVHYEAHNYVASIGKVVFLNKVPYIAVITRINAIRVVDFEGEA